MRRPLLAALLLASATGFAPRTPLQHSLRPLAASPLQLRPVLPRARKSPPIVASAADAAAEAPAAEATKPKEWDEGFRKRRLLIFAFTVVAYACFYLTRNSLYYTAPAMVAAPELNLDITSIGIITSIFPLFYGCSKFVSGVVGDVLSARAMLACGLGLTVRRAAPRRAALAPRRHPHLHHLHTLPAHTTSTTSRRSSTSCSASARRCRGSACCGASTASCRAGAARRARRSSRRGSPPRSAARTGGSGTSRTTSARSSRRCSPAPPRAPSAGGGASSRPASSASPSPDSCTPSFATRRKTSAASRPRWRRPTTRRRSRWRRRWRRPSSRAAPRWGWSSASARTSFRSPRCGCSRSRSSSST